MLITTVGFIAALINAGYAIYFLTKGKEQYFYNHMIVAILFMIWVEVT